MVSVCQIMKTLTLKFENKEKHPWSDREGNRGGRDYIMHERTKIQSGGWKGYEWVRWTKDEGSGRRTPCPTLVSN
jgi:hypothetical protein